MHIPFRRPRRVPVKQDATQRRDAATRPAVLEALLDATSAHDAIPALIARDRAEEPSPQTASGSPLRRRLRRV